MRKLFRQFSFPGGIPSHVAPETPGSIHEGGELGYALAHAFGAAFDNPDLVVACVVGDGEAETGPLATSWHGNKFLNARDDGAVLPVLQLNGYKIANPTVLARDPGGRARRAASRATDGGPSSSQGTSREAVHQAFAAALDDALDEIREIQRGARAAGHGAPALADDRPADPKGWTGPKEVDGLPIEGTWRSHQVPITDVRKNPDHLRAARGLAAELPAGGAVRRGRPPRRELAELPPRGERRMSANPHANGGVLLRDLGLPDFRDYAVEVPKPGTTSSEATGYSAASCATSYGQPGQLPHLRARTKRPRTGSMRLRGRPTSAWEAEIRPDRREPRARGPHRRSPLGAPLPGLARGLPADRPARPLQLLRGVHPHRRLDVQPARQVAEGHAPHRPGGARSRR